MKKIGVIFGGVTCEHDVSVVTGLQLIENINREKYEIYPIYIHSDGEWYMGDELLNANIYREFSKYESGLKKVIIPPNKKGIYVFEKGFFAKNKLLPIDAVILAMHGMNGEDGTLQGLLELANIPYTSSGVLGSSVGMDKILMKKVFEAHQFPILPYTYFTRDEWKENSEKVIEKIEKDIPYPMFVKPSNLGSSIGISKAKNKEELKNAIEIAIQYDSRVIVEKGVNNLKEINCSALGYGNDVMTSVCEEPVSWQEFLTFEDKYLHGSKTSNSETSSSKIMGSKISSSKIADNNLGSKIVGDKFTGSKLAGSKFLGGKQGGMENMERRIPANIPENQTEEIQSLTKNIFKCLNSKGVVRVDFIIDTDENKIYVNEINTIPGSMSFYLWRYSGITYSNLIDKLVAIAEKASEDKNKNNYTYKSDIIGNITKIEK